MSTWAEVGKALAAAAKACSPLSRSGGEPEREPDDTELAVLNALSVELREKYDPATHGAIARWCFFVKSANFFSSTP